jgi:hypothetical protein
MRGGMAILQSSYAFLLISARHAGAYASDIQQHSRWSLSAATGFATSRASIRAPVAHNRTANNAIERQRHRGKVVESG